MPNNSLTELAARISALEKLVRDLSRTSRLANSSIENGAITVYDADGTLRGSIGVQDDGTVAVAAVNGPPPPAPTAPTATSVLGGVAVGWDGHFADGSQAPADFAYVEVHFATDPDFPDDGTLFSAFYSPAGGTMTVPATDPLWVRLVCVSTSNSPSAPSAPAGPVGPTPVVAQSVLDGIVTELALADGAVSAAKLAAAAVEADALAAGAVTTASMTAGSINGDRLAVGTIAADRITAASITASQIKALGITGDRLAVNTVTADKLAAGTITAASGVISSIDASKITVGKISANQIDTTNLVVGSAGTVTGSIGAGVSVPAGQLSAAQIPASTSISGASIVTGSVDATKLVVSGVASNLVVDPGFETTAGAALVAAAGTGWSLDTATYSSGTRSAKFSGTAGTATTSDLQVLKGVPVTPGDQVYFSVDWSATALAGSATVAQKFYLRWKNAAGATLSYSVLTAPATLDGTWRTMNGTATAPAGAVTFDAAAQAFQYTAATLWWDNIIVRPMLGATQIQAGAIQTSHLAADAIDGKVITGADIRTAATGQRIEIVPHGPLSWNNGDRDFYPPGVVWYTGNTDEVAPGELTQYLRSSEFGSQAVVEMRTPDVGYGIGSLLLQAGNRGGDPAGLLVEVADMTLMVNNYSGFVVGSSTELFVRADGTDNIYFGSVSVGLVQNWTTPALASGYSGNGNSNGTVQYRVIDFLGTRFVQWRGGLNLTYSSGAIANGGAPFSAALPSVARPSARRTVPVASSLSSTTYPSLKIDFETSGAASIVGTTSTATPPWVSLNSVMYSL